MANTPKPYTPNQLAALKRERAALHARGLDDRVGLVEDELKAGGVNKGDLDKLPGRRRTAAQVAPATPAPGGTPDPAGPATPAGGAEGSDQGTGKGA